MLISQKDQSLPGWWGKCQIHVTYSNQEKESQDLSRSKTNEKVLEKGQKREENKGTPELLILVFFE